MLFFGGRKERVFGGSATLNWNLILVVSPRIVGLGFGKGRI